MKPSERIKEIHKALKILDGQSFEDINFDNISYFEKAILQYLNEKELGTSLEQRTKVEK